jgi:hypothetical protein
MPVSTVSLKDCVEERFKRGNNRNPQVYFSRDERGNFQPSDFINVLGEYCAVDMSLSLTVELDGEIRALRVDPAEYPCIVRVVSAQLEQNGVSSSILSDGSFFSTNGRALSGALQRAKDGTDTSDRDALASPIVFFGHDDPQFLLTGLPEGRKVVRLCYIIEELSQETISAMAACFEGLDKEAEKAQSAHNKGGLHGRLVSKLKRS